MKPNDHSRRPFTECPHCEARSIVTSSHRETALSRELRYRCTDENCGHTFVAQLVIIRTVVPSIRPNPQVSLPFANPNLTQPRRAANDDTPRRAANDEAPAAQEAVDPMSG